MIWYFSLPSRDISRGFYIFEEHPVIVGMQISTTNVARRVISAGFNIIMVTHGIWLGTNKLLIMKISSMHLSNIWVGPTCRNMDILYLFVNFARGEYTARKLCRSAIQWKSFGFCWKDTDKSGLLLHSQCREYWYTYTHAATKGDSYNSWWPSIERKIVRTQLHHHRICTMNSTK